MKIGDKVVVVEGSSDGHIGKVIRVEPNGRIRIVRDADGVEVDLPKNNYVKLD
jgi:ribosomal protein L24